MGRKILKIGSGSFNDIVVSDESVQTGHCRIILDEDGLFVENSDRKSETYINGNLINYRSALSDGDELKVGEVVVDWKEKWGKVPAVVRYDKQSLKDYVEANHIEKGRNGFVTFWLWFNIVVNAIVAIRSVFTYVKLADAFDDFQTLSYLMDDTSFQDFPSHMIIALFVSFLFCVGIIVGNIMILRWKKSGFWLNCIVTAVCTVLLFVYCRIILGDLNAMGAHISPIIEGFAMGTIIGTPFSLLVQWAFMQITKNGVSCWKGCDIWGKASEES